MIKEHTRDIQTEFALKKNSEISDYLGKKVSQKAFYGIHVQFGFNQI